MSWLYDVLSHRFKDAFQKLLFFPLMEYLKPDLQKASM